MANAVLIIKDFSTFAAVRTHRWGIRVLVFFAVALIGSGPRSFSQRLHDSTADRLMEATQAKFNELTTKDHDAFAAAADNMQKIHQHDMDILREKNIAKVNAAVNRLPFRTWHEFLDRAQRKRNLILGFEKNDPDFPTEPFPDLTTKKQAGQAEIANISAELNAAKDAPVDIPKTVSAIEQTVQNVIAAGKINKLDLDTIKSKADSLQNLPDTFSNLKSIANLIVKPEGLTPLILDARLRRLKLEMERVDFHLEHGRARKQSLDDFQNRVKLVAGTAEEKGWCDPKPNNASDLGLFRYFLGACPNSGPNTEKPAQSCSTGTVNAYGACGDEQIITTIARLAKAAHGFDKDPLKARKSLSDLLSMLGIYTSIIGTQQFLLESDDIEQQYSETLFQLRMLEFDSEEHVVMLGAGIDGLAIYEKGGIRAEDVAHLIQAAQTAAVGAIAAQH